MLNYIIAEIMKWKRRRLWIVFAVLFVNSLAVHFNVYKILLQENTGTALNGEMIFMSIYPIMYLIQIMAASVLGSILFSQEYQHRTFIQLKTFPISAPRYLFSKIIFLFILTFLISLENVFSILCVCITYQIPLKAAFLMFLFGNGFVSSILAVIAVIPWITIAILFHKNTIIPVVCSILCVLIPLLPTLNEWHVSVGGMAEKFMQYIYPPSSSTIVYISFIFRFISPESYGLYPPGVNVPILLINFSLIALLFLVLQGILIKKREV